MHLRALWELPHQNAVPPPVTTSDIEHFNRRFKSEDDVRVSVTTSLDANEVNIVGARARVNALKASLSGPYSITSNHIKRISEDFLLIMFRAVAHFGLTRWAPDILSRDPDSMYNLLHEHIALATFEQVSASYGYTHVGNNLAHVRDFALMRKLYRSFVYSHMVNIAKLEAKQPGKVAMLNDMGNVWKRRQEVCLLLLYPHFLLMIIVQSLQEVVLNISKTRASMSMCLHWLKKTRHIPTTSLHRLLGVTQPLESQFTTSSRRMVVRRKSQTFSEPLMCSVA